MVGEILRPVLVIVVAFGLRFVLKALKFELNEGVLNALVLAIVSFLLAAIGVEAGVRAGFLAAY